MSNVFREIAEWAGELPYWEQAALDKVLSQNELNEVDYDELLQYLLEDAQLVEKVSIRQILCFQEGLYANLEDTKSVLLKDISKLTNVNALVPDQRLTFNQQLTAIFGRNGSGKSGYARVLGCAGFTRGDQEVLPDINKPYDKKQPMSAEISVDVAGIEKIITYKAGASCRELASFYVFDSTSVKVHMTGKNEFSFSPAGLSVLTELATVTDKIRAKLREKISEKEKAAEYKKFFSGESDVTALIESLSPDTDLAQFRLLATFDANDERRIHELNVAIGNIGLEKAQEEIHQKEQQLGYMRGLYSWIDRASILLSDQAIGDINQQIEDYQVLDQRAQQLSADRFKHQRLTQTGSDIWVDFIQAAKRLADTESVETQYPLVGDPCLLCQQPLSQNAHQLILNLWGYLAGEIRADLENADTALANKHSELHNPGEFDLDENLSPIIELLARTDKRISQQIQPLIESYHSRGKIIEQALLDKKQAVKVLLAIEDPSPVLIAHIKELEVEITELKSENLEEKRNKLEAERRVLEHRKKLGELLPEIEGYINGLVWARDAAKVGGSTHHITGKYNQLFSQLVKNRYITIFEKTLTDLGRPLQVEIATSGKKGQTVKQVVLKSHSTAKSIADPEKVLSEGEKRAVALADFLTEVALDTGSSGIILDDPVTSLDLDWRKTIAQILVREATKRQVVVFTHDMPFLYLLLKFAEDSSVNKSIHWIKRGAEDDQPGYVWLDNCPALESGYRKPAQAQNILSEALNTKEPQKLERVLKNGFGALRSTYEAFIVYELLNEVVVRFDERISFGRLKGIAWDTGIVEEVIGTCERLSRYIEGHLHSDALGTTIELTPNLLKEEIDKFSNVKRRLQQLKKL